MSTMSDLDYRIGVNACEVPMRRTLAQCPNVPEYVVAYGVGESNTLVCAAHLHGATSPPVHYPEELTITPVATLVGAGRR